MARPPRNDLAVQDFARSIRRVLATLTEKPTAKAIELHIYATHGAKVSDETIRKALQGNINPEAVQIELLLGLMDYLKVGPSDLGSFAERRIASVLSLVGSPPSGGPDAPSTLGVSASGDKTNSTATITVLYPVSAAA